MEGETESCRSSAPLAGDAVTGLAGHGHLWISRDVRASEISYPVA
jgi:hypothetical protein